MILDRTAEDTKPLIGFSKLRLKKTTQIFFGHERIMAAHYQLEVAISSAKNLKNLNWQHGPLRSYLVIWVNPKKAKTYYLHVWTRRDTNPLFGIKKSFYLID